MARQAITFDFHNTIAHCDEWFKIEVHRLPSEFLSWRARLHGNLPDSTLLTEADSMYRRLRRAIHRHGHELSAERSIQTITESLGLMVEPDVIECGVHALMQAAFESVQPVDGAIGAIRELSAADVPLGIVSSAVYHPFLLWTLDRFDISHCFREVTTSASAGFYKSRPEIFWQTVERLDADPSACVHVGDSLRFDVGGAKQAGMRTAWLNDRQMPVGVGPDLTMTTLRGAAAELLALLDGTAP